MFNVIFVAENSVKKLQKGTFHFVRKRTNKFHGQQIWRRNEILNKMMFKFYLFSSVKVNNIKL